MEKVDGKSSGQLMFKALWMAKLCQASSTMMISFGFLDWRQFRVRDEFCEERQQCFVSSESHIFGIGLRDDQYSCSQFRAVNRRASGEKGSASALRLVALHIKWLTTDNQVSHNSLFSQVYCVPTI
jgi:hypothetical protein